MNDSEIIKSLECCCGNNELGCVRCSFFNYDGDDCGKVLIGLALSLINRQNEQIEKLHKKSHLQRKRKKQKCRIKGTYLTRIF